MVQKEKPKCTGQSLTFFIMGKKYHSLDILECAISQKKLKPFQWFFAPQYTTLITDMKFPIT